jgi:hypothetical protein
MYNSDFEFKFYTGYFTRIFLQFLASNYTIGWKKLKFDYISLCASEPSCLFANHPTP